MEASERELWVLNFFRNSELHGALLMGRLARTLSDTDLLANATRHCATEARHAAMLSETIASVGGRIDPRIETVQERYSSKGGIPASLVDLLVLSEVLEKRVLGTYRAYVDGSNVHPSVKETLLEIIQEMEKEEEGDHAGWIDQALDSLPREAVEAAEGRWLAVDQAVVKDIEDMVNARFPEAENRS